MIHVYNDLPIKNTQRYGMCITMVGGRLTPKAKNLASLEQRFRRGEDAA